MFNPRKITELVPSLETVQNLSRFIAGLPRISVSVPSLNLAKIKKGGSATKDQMVINGYMNHQV